MCSDFPCQEKNIESPQTKEIFSNLAEFPFVEITKIPSISTDSLMLTPLLYDDTMRYHNELSPLYTILYHVCLDGRILGH
jgi:hypothetical protein